MYTHDFYAQHLRFLFTCLLPSVSMINQLILPYDVAVLVTPTRENTGKSFIFPWINEINYKDP